MKNIAKYLVLLTIVASLAACDKKADAPAKTDDATQTAKAVEKKDAPKDTAKTVVLKEIDPKDDMGIGPIKAAMTLTAVDEAMADAGKKLYKEKCTACHKLNKRYIGPALKGVTKRRRPEWVMNMILNPMEMVEKNAAAKKLLQEYSAPMADQSLTNEEARSILEYFRRLDAKTAKAAEAPKDAKDSK